VTARHSRISGRPVDLRQDDAMSLEVRTGSGTGFELLLAAAAVADSDWRRVFTYGQAAYAEVRHADPGLVPVVRRFGRFGWINLAGLLAESPAPWTRRRLARLVAGTAPDELLTALVGGRRQQLRARLDDETIRAAVAGDPAAQRRLRATVADTLLQINPWLLRTDPSEVKEICVQVLETMPRLDARAPATGAIERMLDDLGGEALLERVAPGIHYAPGYLERVTLVTSVRAAPILVSVDEVGHTVILHPALTDEGTTDAAVQLRELGRALGDDTRIRILQELRAGDRTLAELCSALRSPRTTLLHHLALLRSAGLVDLTVMPGAPNVYALDDRGFEAVAAAAKAFTSR
jgi:DNA-binding transcriptional ArsR family regulator